MMHDMDALNMFVDMHGGNNDGTHATEAMFWSPIVLIDVAHELFDHMLHRDTDAKQVEFNLPMVSVAFAHKLFGDMTPTGGIWDDEFVHEMSTFYQTTYVEHVVPNLDEVVFMT
jgi:hypothetical protein